MRISAASEGGKIFVVVEVGARIDKQTNKQTIQKLKVYHSRIELMIT